MECKRWSRQEGSDTALNWLPCYIQWFWSQTVAYEGYILGGFLPDLMLGWLNDIWVLENQHPRLLAVPQLHGIDNEGGVVVRGEDEEEVVKLPVGRRETGRTAIGRAKVWG